MPPAIHRRIRRERRYAITPSLGGIELLQADYHAHRFAPHAQERAVVAVASAGEAVVWSSGRTLPMRPGEVLFIPPGVVHSAATVGGDAWRYRALYLTAGQIRHLMAAQPLEAERLVLEPAVLAAPRAADALGSAHARILAEGGVDAGAEAVLRETLVELGRAVARWWEAHPAEHAKASGLARARLAVDQDPGRRWTLGELAGVAGMSRFHFAHTFSEAYGVSPCAYGAQARLNRARDLLAAGMPITEAAHRLGFADQSHLTRRFLSVVGVTPGEYRDAWASRRVR